MAADDQELETLRQTNSELVAKAGTRKERITALEAEVADLKQQLAAKDKANCDEKARNDVFVHQHFVQNIARELAEDISTAPKLMLPILLKRLSVSKNGTPETIVLNEAGEPTKLTLSDLKKEMVDNKDLAAIIIATKASGSGAASMPLRSTGWSPAKQDETTKGPDTAALRFGLR